MIARVPHYQNIAEHIRRQIRDGKIRPHDRIGSESALMKQFGVSRQPVIQALKLLETEGTIYREQGKGSYCSPRSAVESRNIGVILNGIDDYLLSQVVMGMTRAASQANISCTVRNAHYSQGDEFSIVEQLCAASVLGVILSPLFEQIQMGQRSELVGRLMELRIPFLLIDSGDAMNELPSLLPDDVRGGYLATRHLVQLGHENIMLFAPVGGPVTARRREGYANALADARIPVKEKLMIAGGIEDDTILTREDFWGARSGPFGEISPDKEDITGYRYFEQVSRMLETNPEVSAAVCYNDFYARFLIDAVKVLGRRVPEDFAVVGFDDSPMAISGPVSLTTVVHPGVRYGVRAIEVMMDIVAGRRPWNYRERMPVSLTVRESSGVSVRHEEEAAPR